jgi:hypothetical protein
MAALLIVLAVTVGLSWRAGLYGRRAGVAEAETDTHEESDSGFVDACARSLVLVLFCLVGLLALGVMYGNVLGAASAGR